MCPTSLLSVSLRPCERVIPYQLRTFQFMSCIFSWEKKNLLKTCKKNHIAWLAYNIWIKKNVWHYGLNLISLGIKCFMKSVHTFSFVSWYRSITLKKTTKKKQLSVLSKYTAKLQPPPWITFLICPRWGLGLEEGPVNPGCQDAGPVDLRNHGSMLPEVF